MEMITAVPPITVLCLLGAQSIKNWTPIKNTALPSICGILGATLGGVTYIFIPSYLPADNFLVALAIGAVSGWAATGVNQMVKQSNK